VAVTNDQVADDPARSGKFSTASIACVAGVYTACFWPMLLGRHFFYGDLGNMHLPLRRFYAESFTEGYSPLWIPNLFSGFYLHAEGQVGMFHPVHWLLYRFADFDAAFALECTLAYPFALVGMLLFLRRLSLAPSSALIGATAFGFSTYLMIRFMHVNVVAVLAHTPWLLLLLDIAARTQRASTKRVAWVGIALLSASQVLLGYPGAFVFSALALGLYGLFLARNFKRWAPLGSLTSAFGVGVLIASVQWIPTFELFLESNRLETSATMLAAQSLHPWNLLQAFAPYLFAERVYQLDTSNPIEQSFYFGAAMPVAVAWLVLRRNELQQRTLLACLAIAATLALILALGRYGGLYWIVTHLPLVGQLRNPARFTLFVHLAGAIAIALAFGDAAKALSRGDARDLRRARVLWLVPALSTAIAGGAYLVSRGAEPTASTATSFTSPWLLFAGPPLFFMATALWVRAARGGALATTALVLFIAGDQAAFAVSLWWTEPPVSVAQFAADTPRGPNGEHGRIAVGYTDYVSVDASGDVTFHASTRRLMRDAHLVWGWTGLMPTRQLPPYVPSDTNESAQVYSPRAIRLAATTHIRKGKELVRMPNPLPRFRFVEHAIVTTDVARDVESIDLRSQALVTTRLDLEEGPSGKIKVLTDRPGEIRLSSEAPARQLLVIAESFHPGWELTIDGNPESLVRAYGDFMGAVVDKGSHEIRLEFRPRSLVAGWAGTSIGLLLLACRYLPVLRYAKRFQSRPMSG
jgi:hypothetical protein